MLNATKEITPDLFIADIVNNNYRTAEVFRKHNIDFCCGGKMSFRMACNIKGINESDVLEELRQSVKGYPNPEQWPVDFMIDFLININHSYFRKNIPVVEDYIDRFVLNHSKKIQEVEQLPIVTQQLANKLNDLLKYERDSLFPYIKSRVYAYNNNESYGRLFIKTLRKLSAEDLEAYHAQIEVFILQLEEISNNFLLPENICTTHKVMLQKLQEYIDYIKQHLFIEKQILIPATLRMENSLLVESVGK